MTEADLVLGMLLAAGFALLGALITYGNVRQARALRALEEAWRDWAERDLQLKRERERRSLQAPPDPQAYLNRIARSLLGREAVRWERTEEGFAGDGLLLSPLPPEAVEGRGFREAARVDALAFEDAWVAETLSLMHAGVPEPRRWRLYVRQRPGRLPRPLARVWS
ncbi:hypothetical protein [Thermoflexus sp.]|uniref:hypothetical protein n=1 Tax=Thermoflexus sp. TaxID=1969742 RepID=UPI002ADDDE28|nr:hypothetical protein [Thermoflexus sp.]